MLLSGIKTNSQSCLLDKNRNAKEKPGMMEVLKDSFGRNLQSGLELLLRPVEIEFYKGQL